MYFYLDYQVALLVGLPVSTCVLSHPFVNLFLYFYLAADVIGVPKEQQAAFNSRRTTTHLGGSPTS